ncbi:MAG: hypothetical protein ACR2LX_14390 [Jatrophihabitans sp.]
MADDGLDAVRARLPGLALEAAVTLSEGERSIVRRVRATAQDGRESWLVVKQYLASDEGWARESAALASVPDAAGVSRLVAVIESPQLIVTEDLGDGPSVADALLGEDRDAAADALAGWAEALADLHVATRGSRERFRAALGVRRGKDKLDESWLPSRLRDAERVLDGHCGSLGVTVPTGAFEQLTGLAARLGGDGAGAALTPADACPDNNVRLGDRCFLIDFEGAQWRHIAWDVAYLQVPWPTCWCAWRLPDLVARRAVDAYRTGAAVGFPQVNGAAFERDVEAAVVGWSMMTAARYLTHALSTELDSDPEFDHAHPAPTRRAIIVHRLDRAARSSELPTLAALAAALREELHRRWGEVPLEMAPAFRSTGRSRTEDR